MDYNEAAFDSAAIRRAAEELDVVDDLEALLGQDLATYGDMAAALHHWAGDGGRYYGPGPSRGNYAPENLLFALQLALGEPTARQFDGDQLFDEPFFHHGDVVVEGSFRTNDTFIITGSLHVGTTYTDCAPDSFVVLGGDLEAEAIYTDGTVFVAGDIRARQFVYGYWCESHCTATTVRAPLLIEDQHMLEVEQREVERYVNQDDFDPEDPRFREWLVDACFDEDGLSRSKLTQVVNAGESIFR